MKEQAPTMKEQLPQAITNNYGVEQQASGLYVAESRVYHSLTAETPVHEKTHLLPEPVQIELGGKEFYVVGESAEQVTPNDESHADQESKAPEEGEAPEAEAVPESEAVAGEAKEAKAPGYEFDVATAEHVVHGSDKLLRNDEERVYAVIEGLHGESEDDVRDIASQVVHDAMNDYWKNQVVEMTSENAVDQMKAAFKHAQTKLREAAKAGQGDPEMGASMSAVRFFQKPDGSWGGAIGHVGDTRMYIQSADGQPVEQLTVDEASEAGTTNYLHAVEGSDAKLSQFVVFDAQPDMRLGFVTDGVYGIDKDELLSLKDFQKAFNIPSPQKAADALLALSRTDGDAAAMIIDFSKELNGDEPVPAKPEGKGKWFEEEGKDRTTVMPADTKERMSWAARQLKKLRDLRDGTAARLMNRNVGKDDGEASKRKKIIGSVLGAVAVLGAGYASYKIGYNIGHDDGGVNAHETLQSWDVQPPAALEHASESVQQSGAAVGDALNNAGEQMQQSYTIKSGENPWTISEQVLRSQGMNPTDLQIAEYNNRLMALNGLDEETAKQIFVGTDLKLPKL